jgi:rare lipoprotein A (peptidoglycan hydrolase)
VKKRIVALALMLALGAQGAWADSVHHRLRQAKVDQASALQALQGVQGDLARISGQLSTAQRLVDAATVRLVDARARERDEEIQLALARDVLVRRVRIAYEQGPATTLDMLLSAQSASDLLSINEFTSHTMLADIDAVARVQQGKAAVARVRQGMQIRQAALARQEQQVQTLLNRMQARVQQAQQAAQEAGVRVQGLEATTRSIAAARSRELERQTLLSSGPADEAQAKLLALLGPSGGRGCGIPSGLRATGQAISGDASWYGDDFAGGPTASGVPFDPSLFTAAHRTLPLGVFLRVHYNGRCAIVLVNDRGPYGNYDRIIDLAQAPAQYLGVGVAHVTADVLVQK